MSDILLEFITSIPTPSPIAFFLGDADVKTKRRIRAKGYTVVEGQYDTFVYHKSHWRLIEHKKLLSLTESAECLPKNGLLEASINHPYSHGIVPKSEDAKKIIRKLFGLNESETFKNLMNKKFTRRDFLKGLGTVAKFGRSIGTAGMDQILSAPLTSDGARAAAEFLAYEIMYAATKEAVYQTWDKVKSLYTKADPNMTQGELATLTGMLKKVDFDALSIADHLDGPSVVGSERTFMNLANPLMTVKQTQGSREIEGTVEDDLIRIRYPEWYEEMNDYKSYKDKNSKNDSQSNDQDSSETVEEPEQSDGFDDLKHKKSDEDQPWLGEQHDKRVGVVSVKHLAKAWPNKKIWLADIDSVLGSV